MEKRQIFRQNMFLHIIKNNNMELSRNSLCQKSKYSMTSVMAAVDDLIEQGLVFESEPLNNTVGRQPVLLQINGDSMYFAGLECNASFVRLSVVNLLNQEYYSDMIDIKQLCAGSILQAMDEILCKLRDEKPELWDKTECVTVGLPGKIDAEKGIGILYFSVKDWLNVDVGDFLNRRFNKKLYFINNIDSIAIGYLAHEKLDENVSTMFVLVRNGVGIRVVSKGTLLSEFGVLCELGHVSAKGSDRLCKCGKRGCYDAEITNHAVLNKAAEAVRADKMPGLSARPENGPDNITLNFFIEQLEKKDASALEIMDNVARYTGEMLAEAIFAFSPDRIIFSSELCRFQPQFTNTVNFAIAKNYPHALNALPSIQYVQPSTLLGAFGTALTGYYKTFRTSDATMELNLNGRISELV